ncbi:zinc ribbon domain-containing protein YjdM [Corynebacterium argentoratense]|jgi:putative alkylphosphonate utilization operon protein phnA|uniref:zinc ribbon domain-containing protein YjdM n=1 Tax=Corynebacterium argentoratense TaxID=42817 RepID=UPI00243137D7|nr:zinc ribbon domain-containing protein YjdM [Corynebacterium argentoratense]
MSIPSCPECSSDYTYELDALIICPECAHEFTADSANNDAETDTQRDVIVDAVGNPLQDGDTVTITTTMKVKGAQQPLKAGIKVRNIRLNPDGGDHNIDCKIDGFGAMKLKSSIVKKA